MFTPMASGVQAIAAAARLAGYPRNEANGEVKTERAKQRIKGTQPGRQRRDFNIGSMGALRRRRGRAA